MASFWERIKESAKLQIEPIELQAGTTDLSKVEMIRPAELVSYSPTTINMDNVLQIDEAQLLMTANLRLTREQANEILRQREAERQALEVEKQWWRRELEIESTVFEGAPVQEIRTIVGVHGIPGPGFAGLEGAYSGQQRYWIGLTDQISTILSYPDDRLFARLVTSEKPDLTTSPLDVFRTGIPLESQISIGEIYGQQILGLEVGTPLRSFASVKPDRFARRIMLFGTVTDQNHIDPNNRLVLDLRPER